MKMNSISPSKQSHETQKFEFDPCEILESISDAFYAVDVNWCLTYINHRAEEWFQRNREDLLGAVIWDIFPQSGETICWQMHKKSASERVHVHWEMLFPNSQAWVEANAYPISEGGLAVYFHDITEKRKTEAALCESEVRVKSLLDNLIDNTNIKQAKSSLLKANERFDRALNRLNDSFAIADSQWRYLYVNEEYVKTIGRPREQLLGKVVWDIIPESIGTLNYVNCMKTAEDRISRVWTAHSPFSDYWMEYRTFAWDEGVAMLARDITQSQQAEEALRNSELKFRLLAEFTGLLLSAGKPENVIRVIATRLMDQLHCDVFFNYILEEKQNRLRLNACGGVAPEIASSLEWLDLGEAICGCVAREGCAIITEKVQENADRRADLVRSLGVNAYACFPLRLDDKIIGTLSFGSNSRTGFTESELELISGVADQISVAMQRQRFEEALSESEANYHQIIETANEGVIIGNPHGEILFVNPRMAEMLGYSSEELMGRNAMEFLEPNQEAIVLENRIKLSQNLQLQQELKFHRKDGSFIWTLVNSSPLKNKEGVHIGNLGMHTEITERKVKEEELYRLNRTMRAISNSNQALIHATDEAVFLQEVCRIITEDCGHAMVWIGYAEEDEKRSVRPVAYAGFEEGYLETLQITWADTDRGRGPTGLAIRSGRPCFCRNMLTDPAFLPWREQAIKRGYASSVVLPLLSGDKALGALTIYARKPDSFSEDEVRLLNELASDLTYGIETLRLRAARMQAEEALRQSHEELEYRVLERTAELQRSYEQVKAEIEERRRIEEALRESEEKLQDSNSRLRQLSNKVVSNLEEERSAISRELHDEAGQALTALKMYIELIMQELPVEAAGVQQRLAEAVNLTDQTLKNIRRLAQDLRPPGLDALGLNFTLEDFCCEFGKRVGLDIQYQGCELPVLTAMARISLYRFLQEALTNVVKHAKADSVQVRLDYHDGQISLVVKDNGIGFELNNEEARAGVRKGNNLGLVGMQERLTMLGGKLTIDSGPGRGTCLAAKIPWEAVQ